jgi:hypothetical protein
MDIEGFDVLIAVMALSILLEEFCLLGCYAVWIL